MNRLSLCISVCFHVGMAVAMSFSQSWSNPGHKQSFSMVMDGLSGKNFTAACKTITAAADSKCEAYYRAVGLMKNIPNHRFMGHWGWAGDIPKETFERGKTLGISRSQIEGIWQRIHRETVDEVIRTTGLPEQFADPFAGILYDAHLLHDYTGEFSEALQDVKLVRRDILKNLHRMFGKNSDYVREVERTIDACLTGVPKEDQPRVLLNILTKQDVGRKIASTFGNRYLEKKGIVYTESLAAKVATGSKGVNEQFFARSLASAIKSSGQRVDDMQVQRVVKGVYSEITKNGKKAYRLQIPLQFTPEERIAAQYAKDCLEEGVSPDRVQDLVAQRLRDPNLKDSSGELIFKNGQRMSEDRVVGTAENATKWANLCRNKLTLGLKTGILSFIITEGVTVCTFAATDMTEEEFVWETMKNLGGAVIDGTGIVVLVALGANPYTWPGGLIVLGVGIGTHILYDFAWAKLEQHLDSRYFTLDDFLGDLPEEIRLRTTVLSPTDFASLSENNARRLSVIDFQQEQQRLSATSLDIPVKRGGALAPAGRDSILDSPISHRNTLDLFESKRSKND